MTTSPTAPARTRTVRFHAYGEPTDVLHLEHAEVPAPGPGRIRVRVAACGVNPADWALCRGLFAGDLPRGIGLEVSGTVEALGEGVAGVAVGDLVLGTPDWSRLPSAGAADVAVLEHWALVPEGLDAQRAAALPMAVETAHRSLDLLGVTDRDDPQPGDAGHRRQTVLVHGAGTTVGYAAVQIALRRGARVVATAGAAYAEQLHALGAEVTAYGEGMVERVLDVAGGPVDLVFDTAPASGVLPELVRCAGGTASRVVTASDHPAAQALGVRTNLAGGLRYDRLREYAELAAQGRFTVPIARTYALQDWRTAMETSLSGRAGGKLLLLPPQDSAA